MYKISATFQLVLIVFLLGSQTHWRQQKHLFNMFFDDVWMFDIHQKDEVGAEGVANESGVSEFVKFENCDVSFQEILFNVFFVVNSHCFGFYVESHPS